MAWITLYDDEWMSVRQDSDDDRLILEVNDGGIATEYVTIRMDRAQAARLADVLARFADAEKPR